MKVYESQEGAAVSWTKSSQFSKLLHLAFIHREQRALSKVENGSTFRGDRSWCAHLFL